MKQYKDDFVTYEIALALKGLGFKLNNPFAYFDINHHTYSIRTDAIRSYVLNNAFPAPLWQQATDWLRENYNFNIKYEPTINKNYDVFLNKGIGWEFYKSLPYYEAREQIILKAIEILKNR